MSKWYGQVGFKTTTEDAPGVWAEHIIERNYFGDLMRNYQQVESTDIVNGMNMSNNISILADPFAYENFQHMIYVTYMGTKWKVSTVDVEYPRITLSIGGVYHGESS